MAASNIAKAEEFLKDGSLEACLEQLKAGIREDPASGKLRVFLFQALAVQGDWNKALTQLNVAADLDPGNLLLAQVGRTLLNVEAFRAEVFGRGRTPLVFGEPAPWMGILLKALECWAQGQAEAAEALRNEAFEAAPAIPGAINGEPFEWLADADARLGPVLEAVIEGRYYWIALANIQFLRTEKPVDLRDVVWLPASFRWKNGGEAMGFIPARYPGSETGDDALRLGRKTEWVEDNGLSRGLGQRLLATDKNDYPLLEVREISFAENAG